MHSSNEFSTAYILCGDLLLFFLIFILHAIIYNGFEILIN